MSSAFLAPIQDEPLQRKVFWNSTGFPDGSKFEVRCCFDVADDDSCLVFTDIQEGEYTVDFKQKILDVGQSRMEKFSQGDYTCTVSLCLGECGQPTTANIKCGFGGFNSFSSSEITQITGDPSNDGWFRVGNLDDDSIGALADIKSTGTYYGDKIPKVDVYAAAFIVTDSITFDAASGEQGNFQTGDRVIGVGWVATDSWVTNTANLYFKLAPSSGNGWRPSTVNSRTGGFNGEDSFSGSAKVSGQVQLQTQNSGFKAVTPFDFTLAGGDVVYKQYGSGNQAATVEFLVKVDSLGTDDKSFNRLFGNGWKMVGNTADFRYCSGGQCEGGTNDGVDTSMIAFSLPAMCTA